ncbi:MAG: hypothetical protein QOE35_294 [Actinomycetota bacterium]|jgi:exopolysaccharide biosynthesis polyprenyl glycosylphosphotransferase
MLVDSEITADRSVFEVASTISRQAVDGRRALVRDTVWVRPVVDVLAVTAVVAAIGAFSPAFVVYGVLVLLGLAVDWYRPVPLAASAAEDVRRVAVRAALPALVVLPFASRESWAVAAVAVFGAVGVGRAVAYGLVRMARRAGLVVEPVLLLGSGDQVLALRERLWSHRELGLRPMLATSVSLNGDPAVFLSADEIDSAVRRQQVRRLVVAGGSGYDAELVSTVRAATTSFEILYLPGQQQPDLGLRSGGEVVAGYPVQRLHGGPNRLGARIGKRAVDLVGASVLILLFLPVLAAAAIAVKLTSRGPVLFRQARIGRNGQTFDMMKFRSFPTDHEDVELALPLEGCPLPVGRFLRRTSIDELPQLFNVLRGEMSIVGPRPERPHFAEPMSAKIPEYDARHRVAGGLTGLAQVHGYWGLSEIEARVRLDNHYIDTWSLWGDLSIIARTVPAVIVKSFA